MATPPTQNHYQCLISCNDLNMHLIASLPQEFTWDASSSYDAPFAQGLNGMMPGVGNAARFIGVSLTNQALTAQVWQGSGDVQFTLPLVFQAETDEQKDVIYPLMQLLSLTFPKEDQVGGILSAPGPHIDYKKFSNQMSGEAGRVISSGLSALGDTKLLDPFKKGDGVLGGLANVAGSVIGSAINTANAVSAPLSSVINSSIVNKISLSIGHYLKFSSVIITDVQQTHSVQPVIVSGKPTGNYQRVEVNVTFKTMFTPTSRDIKDMFPSGGRAYAMLSPTSSSLSGAGGGLGGLLSGGIAGVASSLVGSAVNSLKTAALGAVTGAARSAISKLL